MSAFPAIHELRAVAHVVDMHQLTKDPKNLLAGSREESRQNPCQDRRFFRDNNTCLNLLDNGPCRRIVCGVFINSGKSVRSVVKLPIVQLRPAQQCPC